MAELTDFARLHSPFLSIIIAFLLSIALRKIFGLSKWCFVFFLLILGSQQSLAYHSSIIRSELYSVFYWAGAILAIAFAAKSSTYRQSFISLLITGLLLGLTFLTKIQSLFYLIAAALIIFALYYGPDSKQKEIRITPKIALASMIISFVNLLLFLIMAIAAHYESIPKGLKTWAKRFGITPIFILFVSVFVLLFLSQFFLYLKKRLAGAFKLSSFMTIVAFGFILSFACHFLLFSEPSNGLKLALLDFKMVFLRETKLTEVQSLNTILAEFVSFVCYNPALFIVNIILAIILFLGRIYKFIRITKPQLIFLLLLCSVAFINIMLGTRPILKDILWRELLINLLSLMFFALIIKNCIRHRRACITSGALLLSILFFVNCAHSARMTAKIDAEYNQYGWWEDRWFRQVFKVNHPEYQRIMQSKYNKSMRPIAKAKAIEHEEIRRTAKFVFRDQGLTHENISIAWEGFSVWRNDLGYKIAELPQEIKGAMVVDINAENLEKLPVLTRRDLAILMFVHPDDFNLLTNSQIMQTNLKIPLKKDKQVIIMHGLFIKNPFYKDATNIEQLDIKYFTEIPLDKLSNRFFFVIQKK